MPIPQQSGRLGSILLEGMNYLHGREGARRGPPLLGRDLVSCPRNIKAQKVGK